MVKWLKRLFKKKPNPYQGLFVGWTIDKHYARSPDSSFVLWIANGFDYFRDADHYRQERRLLTDVSNYERRLIWDALWSDAEDTRLDEHKKALAYLRTKPWQINGS